MKDILQKCSVCGLAKRDVRERPNAYAQDIYNELSATHVVCDKCDEQNRADI